MPSSKHEHSNPRLPLPRLARISFSLEGAPSCPDGARDRHDGDDAAHLPHAADAAPARFSHDGACGVSETAACGAESSGLDLLVDSRLFDACGVRIAFSSRAGGVSAGPFSSLNLSDKVGDDADAVAANRRRLLHALGAARLQERLVVPDQVHGTRLVVVDGGGEGDVERAQADARAGSDGVVCTCPDVPVLLCFADCVPVVLVAPGGAFAVVHAGWRGALGGISGAALSALACEAGCAPGQCNAYIGPHIGACCYETSAEVLARFTEAFGAACDAGGRHLDLAAAVASDLLAAGADPSRIVDAGICTSCSSGDYYSYRAHGAATGRHGAYACKEGTGTWD